MITSNHDWLSAVDAELPLQGAAARVEPMRMQHLDGLCSAGLEEDLWRWTVSEVTSREHMGAYVASALALRETAHAFPFTVFDATTNEIAGSTRYGSVDAANRRVEIGWTWLGATWRRTRMNTEVKYLLLRMAFEQLGCVRVEFKTDVLNERSRAALLRIGAREEGVLRSHMITEGGRIRDTMYFSIIDSEWAAVSAALRKRLDLTGA